MKYKNKNEEYRKNMMSKALELFNKLPDDMKELPKKKFQMKLKKMRIDD